MPGPIAPTSQLAWLISITAISVLSWSRAVRDRLKSLGCGMGVLHRFFPATMVPPPRRPPHTISHPRVETMVFVRALRPVLPEKTTVRDPLAPPQDLPYDAA